MFNSKQRQKLKRLAHSLRPVIHVGKNGLDISVNKAVARELLAHELIKIKLLDTCELPKQEIAARLADTAQAEMVNIIGRTIILYKEHPLEPRIKL
jgi:RNA-binding protein